MHQQILINKMSTHSFRAIKFQSLQYMDCRGHIRDKVMDCTHKS